MPQRAAIKKLANVNCPVSQTAVYTSPVDKQAIISSVVLCNTHASASATVQLWLVPNAVSVTNNIHQFLIKTLTAKQTSVVQIPLILEASDKIYAVCDTGNVALFLHGSEVMTV